MNPPYSSGGDKPPKEWLKRIVFVFGLKIVLTRMPGLMDRLDSRLRGNDERDTTKGTTPHLRGNDECQHNVNEQATPPLCKAEQDADRDKCDTNKRTAPLPRAVIPGLIGDPVIDH